MHLQQSHFFYSLSSKPGTHFSASNYWYQAFPPSTKYSSTSFNINNLYPSFESHIRHFFFGKMLLEDSSIEQSLLPLISSAAAAESLQLRPTVGPHRRQPTRLPCPWDSPGKNTGVGCHFLLQCMKLKSESEVTQSCLTLSDPMDCSLPGSSIHGIFQAGVLEWSAIAFSADLI